MKPSNYDLQVDIGKRIFLEYDQSVLIRKFNLEADDNWIYLTYLNIPCRINREDGRIEESRNDVWQECRSFTAVMTIYDLLCYHKGDTAPVLFETWCPIDTFVVSGVQDTEYYTKKYAAVFQDHTDELKAASQKLSGVIQPSMAGADVTCIFQITPYFPVLMQFWEGDDEFPPQVKLLWDRNTEQFLHYETTFFLQGDLLERLKDEMNK